MNETEEMKQVFMVTGIRTLRRNPTVHKPKNHQGTAQANRSKC